MSHCCERNRTSLAHDPAPKALCAVLAAFHVAQISAF
jgi:hypothetical protein